MVEDASEMLKSCAVGKPHFHRLFLSGPTRLQHHEVFHRVAYRLVDVKVSLTNVGRYFDADRNCFLQRWRVFFLVFILSGSFRLAPRLQPHEFWIGTPARKAQCWHWPPSARAKIACAKIATEGERDPLMGLEASEIIRTCGP